MLAAVESLGGDEGGSHSYKVHDCYTRGQSPHPNSFVVRFRQHDWGECNQTFEVNVDFFLFEQNNTLVTTSGYCTATSDSLVQNRYVVCEHFNHTLSINFFLH